METPHKKLPSKPVKSALEGYPNTEVPAKIFI